jgi:hypothetical protein
MDANVKAALAALGIKGILTELSHYCDAQQRAVIAQQPMDNAEDRAEALMWAQAADVLAQAKLDIDGEI